MSLIGVPVAAEGVAVATHSAGGITNAIKNLSTQESRILKSSSSNTGTRKKNRIPDKGEFNSIQSNCPGTTMKKYGPDGNVQKEFNKGHVGEKTPKNERDDHIHDYKPNPSNPSGRGIRQPNRPLKKNELNKDFDI